VYGTLRRGQAEGWLLEVTLLVVDDGAVTTASLPLTDADLAAARIDATADLVAERLAPDTAVSDAPTSSAGRLAPPPPPPEPAPREGEEATTDDGAAAERKGKYRFGWERPQPKWKLIGFGVSTGALVASATSTVVLSAWLTSKNWGFRRNLIEAAEASLTDASPLNDVDPNLPENVNLCDYARTRPTDENGVPLGMPGQVRNSAVVKVCNDADTRRDHLLVSGIATGVSLASTLVFTLLLLVHRDPPRGSAWRRHRLLVGMDPVPGQGLSLRMGGRF